MDELDLAAKQFQNANMALKYAPKPVVVAPSGARWAAARSACIAPEFALRPTYMGLGKLASALPAGGGTKEMLVRAVDAVPGRGCRPFTYAKEVSDDRHSQSVNQRRRSPQLGYLCPGRFCRHEPRPADCGRKASGARTW